MSKIQLIYASKATPECTEQDFRKIKESAAKRNAQANVTGLLCYGNDRFIQVLEGDSVAVNDIYHRITRDPRHTDFRLLLVEPIPGRFYEGWDMQCVLLDDKPSREIHQIVLKYADGEIFAPEEYSPGYARNFLEDIKNYIRLRSDS